MAKYAKVSVVDAFEFTGEVDPVILWKQKLSDYSPTHYPMSPFMGHGLKIGVGEKGEGGEIYAFKGDFVIRKADNSYEVMSPELFKKKYIAV